MIAPERYVVDERTAGSEYEVAHLDGIPWDEAPAPPRRHVCWPQTRGWIYYVRLVERCPCGRVADGTPSVIFVLRPGDRARVASWWTPRRVSLARSLVVAIVVLLLLAVLGAVASVLTY